MALEWYEWECPHCRRIGQVNPGKGYEDGETVLMSCPHCKTEVMVWCWYQPAFFAYRLEKLKGKARAKMPVDPTESVRKLLEPYESRIEQLEDLCRDFLDAWSDEQEHSFARPLLEMRMQALGLLEGD